MPTFTSGRPRSVEVSSRATRYVQRSEEHTSDLQSRPHLVCRLLLEKKKESMGDIRFFSTFPDLQLSKVILPFHIESVIVNSVTLTSLDMIQHIGNEFFNIY